jgi:DNA replication and repair protein RecF
MRINRLQLTGFRNLEDQLLEIPPEGVAVIGDNAQGKTNLLEAIHYLEAFRSFRGARDDQLVRMGEEIFRLQAHVQDESGPGMAGSSPQGVRDGEVTVAAACEAGTKRKKVTLDGRVVDSIAEAVGRLGSVLFTPEDVRLVSDGPSERRRFLDIVLSLNDPDYLAALQRFRRSLANRNAALKQGGTIPGVAAWDTLMIESGSRILLARARWVREVRELFQHYCREVSGGERAQLEHEPGLPGIESETLTGLSPDQVKESYGDALRESRAMERRRRVTLVGPHRDELRFTLGSAEGERDVRAYGSGGQRRTVALALRLVEADTVRRLRGTEPILLLDDVFAELDENRSERLLDLLGRVLPGQVILTAPKENDVRFRKDLLPRWTMIEGRITA